MPKSRSSAHGQARTKSKHEGHSSAGPGTYFLDCSVCREALATLPMSARTIRNITPFPLNKRSKKFFLRYKMNLRAREVIYLYASALRHYSLLLDELALICGEAPLLPLRSYQNESVVQLGILLLRLESILTDMLSRGT